MRVMREIPKEKMVSGASRTDMRKQVEDDLREKNVQVKEIRMREIGFNSKNLKFKTKLKILEYEASGGEEFFLEVVNEDDVLFGLLRLRFPAGSSNSTQPLREDEVIGKKESHFIEELEGCALVRELHVYGQALNLGERGKVSQHIGLGKELMGEAEKIAKEKGYKKLAVISGVGVKKYYEKLGYKAVGTYMIKEI